MRDLSSLSTAEREVLLLLAQGHTAKSAAAALDLTVGAVNERLREARSKTGANSSRDLARRIRGGENIQKIWPTEIGVAKSERVENKADEPLVRLSIAISKGTLALTTLTFAGGALVAALLFGALTTSAQPAPHVVSTYPAPNARIEAGPLTIRVTFDQPMQSASYSFTTVDTQTFPACAGAPEQSEDRRTFTLACRVEPHRSYEMGFNSARFRNFVSAAATVPATPTVLRFSTR